MENSEARPSDNEKCKLEQSVISSKKTNEKVEAISLKETNRYTRRFEEYSQKHRPFVMIRCNLKMKEIQSFGPLNYNGRHCQNNLITKGSRWNTMHISRNKWLVLNKSKEYFGT